MSTGQWQQEIRFWGVNQDPKDLESPLSAPGTQILIKLCKWVPKGSTPAHMEGPLTCLTWNQSRFQGTVPGFTHKSGHRRKQKRTLNTPVSSWEISDTYSGLQMNAILMNTPKIKFLGIRFLRIALSSQCSLAGVVLQNTQEIDLCIPEQGGTCSGIQRPWMRCDVSG